MNPIQEEHTSHTRVLVLCILLAIAAVAGAYYFYAHTTKKETAAPSVTADSVHPTPQEDTGTITDAQKAKVQASFTKIATLFKNNDKAGIKRYFTDAGLSDMVAGPEPSDQSLKQFYAATFQNDLEKKGGQSISYKNGTRGDGTPYIEMDIEGKGTAEASYKDQHGFILVHNEYYWYPGLFNHSQ